MVVDKTLPVDNSGWLLSALECFQKRLQVFSEERRLCWRILNCHAILLQTSDKIVGEILQGVPGDPFLITVDHNALFDSCHIVSTPFDMPVIRCEVVKGLAAVWAPAT